MRVQVHLGKSQIGNIYNGQVIYDIYSVVKMKPI